MKYIFSYWTYKPGSVFDNHLSRYDISIILKPPLRDGRAAQCPVSRCCSRWGLHSQICYHIAGELLPHLSTLTVFLRRYISVALSLKSPSPVISRHPCPMEPGLSSHAAFWHCIRDYLVQSVTIIIPF